MEYQIQLNNGQVLKMTNVNDFNAETFTQTLNNRETTFVNLGGVIVNKNLIGSITPVTEATQTA